MFIYKVALGNNMVKKNVKQCTALVRELGGPRYEKVVSELSKNDLELCVREAAAKIGITLLHFNYNPQRRSDYATAVVDDGISHKPIGYLTAFSLQRTEYSRDPGGEHFTTASFEINSDPLMFSHDKANQFRSAMQKMGLVPATYCPGSRMRFYTDHEVEVDTALREKRIQPLYR